MKSRAVHLAAALSVTLLIVLNSSAALAQSDLFSYDFSRDPTPRSDNPALVEKYDVSVDLPGLRESHRQAIELQLPDGSRYSIVPDKIHDRGESSFLWRGTLIGSRTVGRGLITVHRGHVAGVLRFPGKYDYELSPGRQEGKARLLVVDTTLFEDDCGVDSGHSDHKQHEQQYDWAAYPGGHEFLPRAPNEQDTHIDLLVLYTSRAAACAANPSSGECFSGGEPENTVQIEADIQDSVDILNDVLEFSEVSLKINLVHTERIAYDGDIPVETGCQNNGVPIPCDPPASAQDQLNWLSGWLSQNSPNGLRDEHRADLVALVTEDMPGRFTGIAKVLRRQYIADPQHARTFRDEMPLSVTARSGLKSSLVFSHEIGHNLGLEHNPQNARGKPFASPQASFPWSFAHWESRTFRTVMSYRDACRCRWNGTTNSCPLDNAPSETASCCNPVLGSDPPECQCNNEGTCDRIPYFSNPDILYQGYPLGIADERDNARTLRLTGPIVARFRLGEHDETYPWLPAIYNLIFN